MAASQYRRRLRAAGHRGPIHVNDSDWLNYLFDFDGSSEPGWLKALDRAAWNNAKVTCAVCLLAHDPRKSPCPVFHPRFLRLLLLSIGRVGAVQFASFGMPQVDRAILRAETERVAPGLWDVSQDEVDAIANRVAGMAVRLRARGWNIKRGDGALWIET